MLLVLQMILMAGVAIGGVGAITTMGREGSQTLPIRLLVFAILCLAGLIVTFPFSPLR